MAKFTIDNILHFATKDKHTHTDWQVALDSEFIEVIDESIKDDVNLLLWRTPLPRIDGPGYYSDEDIIYARARVWRGKDRSNWINLNDNQNYQKVIITQEYKEPIYTDSTAINMQ